MRGGAGRGRRAWQGRLSIGDRGKPNSLAPNPTTEHGDDDNDNKVDDYDATADGNGNNDYDEDDNEGVTLLVKSLLSGC